MIRPWSEHVNRHLAPTASELTVPVPSWQRIWYGKIQHFGLQVSFFLLHESYIPELNTFFAFFLFFFRKKSPPKFQSKPPPGTSRTTSSGPAGAVLFEKSIYMERRFGTMNCQGFFGFVKFELLGGGNSNIFHFHPWLIFFNWVETTNQFVKFSHEILVPLFVKNNLKFELCDWKSTNFGRETSIGVAMFDGLTMWLKISPISWQR